MKRRGILANFRGTSERGYRLARMRDVVCVHAGVLERLLEEARRNRSAECCGLLAGKEKIISEVLPARNQLGSATAYEIAPEELFRLFKQMRAAGLEPLGIYHSHPLGDNKPPAADIERAVYPDVAYLIVSPGTEPVRAIRAFRIRRGFVEELEIRRE